ncbi:MAG: 4Fe-4S binding protein [Desulfobulbus sp.]|nr:4Fe-4S binding protein [Desulfobulbus sp.]
MQLFSVNTATCNRDGTCAKVCPLGIIVWKEGVIPVPATDAARLCIRCGHCVAVCPTGSFNHRDMPMTACPPARPGLPMDEVECEYFLRARRSIRTFRDTPVEQEKLARLIDIARYAPSGRNSQEARWLVIGDRSELRRLSSTVIDWMRWLQENEPVTARRYNAAQLVERWEAGWDVILRDVPALIVTYAKQESRSAPATCTLALCYLELAATTLGLGGCWAGYLNAAAGAFAPLAAALRLPSGFQCYGAMMIGYPRFIYRRLPTRRTPVIEWRM